MSKPNPKETPLLFKAPMVRAIDAGQKTMTRRLVDPQPPEWVTSARQSESDPVVHSFHSKSGYNGGKFTLSVRCPYGGPGDIIWGRENVYIAPPGFGDADQCNATDKEGRRRLVGYSASMDGDSRRCAEELGVKQTPSIHQPRWACRLILEITAVRAERLRDITDEDALAEGVQDALLAPLLGGPREAFKCLWADTYGAESWDVNPWVWTISFRRVA